MSSWFVSIQFSKFLFAIELFNILFMQNVRRMFTPTYEFCRQNFCRTTFSFVIVVVVVVVACVWTFLVILCIISVLRGIFILSFLPNDALDWEKKKIKCFCFINKWMMLMFDLISMEIELAMLRCSSKVIWFHVISVYIWARFHQRSMYSFYARSSPKRKKYS